MFKEILFWKNWNPLFKSIYFFLLFLIVIAFAFFVYGQFFTYDSVIPWQTVNYIDKKPYPLFEISKGIFNIPIENYTYYLSQSFRASTLLVNFYAVNIFFAIQIIGLVFLFSVLSYFKKWWFYVANSLIIITIAGYRFDLFMVFGDIRNFFILGIIISSVGLNVYYHFFKPYTSFAVRLISYIILFGIYATIILLGSTVKAPQLYFTSYGLFAPMIISLIFVFLVSFDVEYMLLFLTTATKSINKKTNTYNFLLISLLYLGNILLTLLNRMNIINWDMFYFSEYQMLGLSTIAGFFVYRRRLESFGEVIPFQPFGAFFYLVLAAITWASIGYAHATGNLSIIRSLKEFILFGHFGISLAFVIFILYNYTVYINDNLPVYEVILQKSKNLIHYVRIGGIIITASLIANHHNITIDYAFAGYYANIADVYMHEKDYPIASQYYKKVAEYKEFDFKRTLGVAAIAEAYDETEAAIDHYNKLHLSFDCEQAYATEAYLYDKLGNYFKAIGVLKDGLAKYPKSSHLTLNLGYEFGKTKQTDSALFYFEMAKLMGGVTDQANTNKTFMAISNGIELDTNDFENGNNYMPLSINQLSYKTLRKEKSANKFVTINNKEEYWLYQINFLANNINFPDTALVYKNINALILKDTNDSYSEALKYSNAMYLFANQKVDKAMEQLYLLKNYYVGSSSIYSNVLGVMTLCQKQNSKAFDYFNESYDERNNVGGMNGLIALVEMNNAAKTTEFAEKLINNTDASVRDFTKEIIDYSQKAVPSNPEEIVKYICINKKKLSSADLLKVANSITDNGLRLTALLIAQTELVDRKDFELAKSVDLTGMNVANMSYKANLNQLFILKSMGNADELLAKIDATKLNIEDQPYKYYLKAWAYNQKADKAATEKNIANMLEGLPLYQDGLLLAVNYYKNLGNIDKAYEICTKGLAINQYAITLKKELCLLSVPKGLGAFVEPQVIELKNELPAQEYELFRKQYDELMVKQSNVFN
jgi:cellulose synthase operon protein C